MREKIDEIIKRINLYSNKQIEITEYCRKKMEQRNIEETLLISTLFSKSLYYIGEQTKSYKGTSEIRYKLIFEISSRYSLIIIVAFYQKALKVVNVIKTSKRLDKLWKKQK